MKNTIQQSNTSNTEPGRPVKIAKTIKTTEEDWENVIKFRGWLENTTGRRVDLGEALGISVKLMLLYLRLGERMHYSLSGTGVEIEKLGFELGKEELEEFATEFRNIVKLAPQEEE